MNFDLQDQELVKLLRAQADAWAEERQAEEAFAEACRLADEDPRERQRILDINDLADAQDAVYAAAVAAVDRGDLAGAEPLLRSSAEAGIGESAWLLATVLEQSGRRPEALLWYQRAAAEGDLRADDKVAHMNVQPDLADKQEHAECRLATSVTKWTAEMPPPTFDQPPALTSHGIFSAADQETWVIPRLATSADIPAALDLLACGPAGEEVARAICRRIPLIFDSYLAARLSSMSMSASRLRSMLHMISATAAAGALTTRPTAFDSILKACVDTNMLLHLTGAEARWRPEMLAHPGGRRPAGLRLRPGARELTAADLMLSLASVPSATPETTLDEAMEQLLESGAQALPVTEAAYVVGIVTLSDLAQAMRQAKGLPSIQRVETLMRVPVTVPGATPAPAVTAIAARSQARLMVVTGPDGAPVGYLTPESLLSAAPDARGGQEPEPRPTSGLLVVPGYLQADCLR